MSSSSEAEYIWRNGECIAWRDANIHILSTAVQFGSSVFEGIRCYEGKRGPAIFRLREHLRRLRDSCRIYRMDLTYSEADLAAACKELVRKNGFASCYLRPMVLRGYGSLAMDGKDNPIDTYIAAWRWGAYLGADALAKGVDVCVSSWNRPAPNTSPGMAKAAGHYNNAQLIKLDALSKGFADAIALSPDGLISEGSGQNVFAVKDRRLITTPINGTNLAGITRDAVKVLAGDLGLEVQECAMPREILYVADELFYTGTASEITPIRSVDHILVGAGARGPVTERLQQRFFDLVGGRVEDKFGWLESV